MSNSEEFVSREVIENKLLAALGDDSSKVAIVASESDLDLMIRAFTLAEEATPSVAEAQQFSLYRTDVEQLKRRAF